MKRQGGYFKNNDINYNRAVRQPLDQDHLYYNVSINNPITSGRIIQANFSETRTESILSDMTDYEVAVIRFKIPTTSIPLFVVAFDKDASGNYIIDASGAYQTPFTISLEYFDASGNATLYTKHVYYYPTASTFINTTLQGGEIFGYQQFLDMINKAYQNAYNDLIAAHVGASTSAPFMTFDPNTDFFSIRAPNTVYYPSTYNNIITPVYPSIKIWMSFRLWRFFSSFLDSYYNDINGDKGVNLYIKDNGNNNDLSSNIITMTQESTSIFQWSKFNSIVLTSNLIPTLPEFIPSSNGNNDTRKIITDFEPLITDQAFNRESLQYFPQGPYRYVDLVGGGALNRFDLQVYWSDYLGNLFPLLLYPGDLLTCKFLFKKRERNEGAYYS